MEIVILIVCSLTIGSTIGLVVATEKEIKEVKKMRQAYEDYRKLDEAVLRKLAEIKRRS